MSKYRPFYGEYENFDNMKLYNNLPKIDVATAFYPVASSIVQNIYDEKSYNNELSYVSTSTAYNDLLSKKVDVIIVTKPSKNQKEMIEKFNEDLKFIPIAREALVFYTRKENTIKSITVDDINKIYTSQIINWKDLNGKNAIINTYQLTKDNGSQTCFEDIVNNNVIDGKKHFEVNDMGKIIDKVSNNRNSIGFSFNSFYTKIYNDSRLKLFYINGVEPSKENIISEKYPLMYDVFFVYNKNNNNENIEKLLEFILSEQGQKIIEIMGLQPIKK